MTKQCLRWRIPDEPTLICEVAAWESTRDTAQCHIDWRFSTANARIKLILLYPSIQVRLRHQGSTNGNDGSFACRSNSIAFSRST